MLVHKGSQINNVQLITGVRIAEMLQLQNCSVKIFKEHSSRYLFHTKKKRWMSTKKMKGGGGGQVGRVDGWICTKNRCFENEGRGELL